MEYTQKVVYQSNYWYNDGLKKAKIRDMTLAFKKVVKEVKQQRLGHLLTEDALETYIGEGIEKLAHK